MRDLQAKRTSRVVCVFEELKTKVIKCLGGGVNEVEVVEKELGSK